MKFIDWKVMAKFAILSPLEKYMKLLGIDHNRLFAEALVEAQGYRYLSDFV